MPTFLPDFTDEELANVGGMPGSIEDYQRTMEFRRRGLAIQREVANAQVLAARWTMCSAIAVAVSVVVTVVGIWLDIIKFTFV